MEGYRFYHGGKGGGAKPPTKAPLDAALRASQRGVSHESVYGDDDMNDHAKNQTATWGGEGDPDSGPALSAGYPVSALAGGGAGLARFAHLAVPAGMVLERRRRAARTPPADEYSLQPVGAARFEFLFDAVATRPAPEKRAAKAGRSRSARRSKKAAAAKSGRARKTKRKRAHS